MPSHKLIVLMFMGPRFEGHGLNIDALLELSAYKKLLQESLKEIWRRKHPDRVRLPKAFDIHLQFIGLRGSTALLELDDELDEAARVLEDAISAAGEKREVPSEIPRVVIRLFKALGRTLHKNEYLLLTSERHRTSVRYDSVVKQRILGWLRSSDDDVADLKGKTREQPRTITGALVTKPISSKTASPLCSEASEDVRAL